MSIGKDIRSFREKGGLSLRKLAKEMKISSQYLSKIEVGKQAPSKTVLVRILRALKIPFRKFQDIYMDSQLEMKIRKLGFEDQETINLCKDLLTMSANEREVILETYRKIQTPYNV